MTKRGFPTRLGAPLVPSIRLPEKAARGTKARRVRGLCTNADLLWKGSRWAFFDFMIANRAQCGPTDDPCRKFRKSPGFGPNKANGETPWTSR